MPDGPQQRAQQRSALLSAGPGAGLAGPDAACPAKLPLGREPDTGSPDWAHRCAVPEARLVPNKDEQCLTAHSSWRMLLPWTSKPPRPCFQDWHCGFRD